MNIFIPKSALENLYNEVSRQQPTEVEAMACVEELAERLKARDGFDELRPRDGLRYDVPVDLMPSFCKVVMSRSFLPGQLLRKALCDMFEFTDDFTFDFYIDKDRRTQIPKGYIQMRKL